MIQTERDIQIRVVSWFRNKYPDEILTTSPTFKIGGLSTRQRIIQWRFMKLMGYLPGTPDILIFCPRGEYKGLLIELKSDKGKIDKEQDALHERFKSKGYFAGTCIGYDDAVKTIETYMSIQARPLYTFIGTVKK